VRVAHANSLAVLILMLSGCGYVGPVLPPSPNIPATITDLSVVERGSELQITFTPPPSTTDNLPIRQFTDVDLRIGPASQPWDFDRWAATAREYPVSIRPRPPGQTNPTPVSDSVPVSDWTGKRVAIAIRTAAKKDRYSSWSNVVHLDVIQPLEPPALAVEATADGYRLHWPDEGPQVHYNVFRQAPSDKTATQIGTSDKPEYLDRSTQWSTPYIYSVVAVKGSAESLPGRSDVQNQRDIFPPSVPAGVAALPSAGVIELSWQRSPEPDLKGYYIYRSVNGGPFEREGDLVSLPAFTDTNVEHGKTYRYEISAIDQTENESAKSHPVEVTFQ